MKRTVTRIAIVLGLVALGWTLSRAQGQTAPSFELEISAPGGATTVRCVRGCTLAWVERGVTANARPIRQFAFNCSGDRCESGRVGGWVTP